MTLAFRIAAVLLVSLSALAQTTPTPSRVFTPADFAQFAPRTALDMLNRVPGFSIRSEELDRGFGQATGNVVVNGQRTSGKSNDVITELGRIPAGNVERIEIVDAATLDIPGLTGQVANIITRSRAISGQFAYRPEFRAYNTDPLFTRFELSLSGTRGAIQYTLGVDNRGNRSGAGGPTWIYSADRTLIESRDETWKANTDRPRLSGKIVYDGPGSAIGNLNVSYGRLYFDYLETGIRSYSDGTERSRRVTIEESGDNHEIGADYEFPIGIGRLKFIGLSRGNRYPSETNVFSSFVDGSELSASRSTGVGDEDEQIGRGEYRWKRGASEWQVSAEAAFNSLDNASELFVLDGGVYERIPLPGATASVAEDRYEVMGSWGRPLSSKVTMKLSAGGEHSTLERIGDADNTRSFFRPKGELSTAWKATPQLDVNIKLARRVGQLNFYDFLASVNLRDDIQTAANPDLVPEQSWELEVEGVRNLGAYGTTTLRVYNHLIDDIIDYIPIGETGQAPGNLDTATVYGLESRSTFNLDAWGWDGARLDASWNWQESEVEDPLTGETRRISGSLMRAASLALRHDVMNTPWAWGGGASYSYYALDYRLDQVGRLWEGPVWADVFLENKDVAGLTLRASVGNLIAADSMWDRTVYEGRRTSGAIDYIEQRDRTIGPVFSFQVRGKF